MKKFLTFAMLAVLSAAAAEEKITAGTEWVPFRFENDIKDGSLLDFSDIMPADRPAGDRHGRLIPNKDGHLIGEKSGERVRLVGANLNFDANFMDKENVDRLARQFRRMGYNSVRLHHTDVLLMNGGWNGVWSSAINSNMLDRLDYTFFAMKREGMYVTTDFYQMRRAHKNELPNLKLKESPGFGSLKGLFPLYDEAFQVWCKYPKKLMEHVNPYTGLTWRDDPALTFVVGTNEDSLMSICGHRPAQGDKKEVRASARYIEAYDKWKEKNAIDFQLGEQMSDKERWMDFMIEKGAGIQRRYGDYLTKDLGYKGLVSGANWWDLKYSAYEREELSIVDNHGYNDHPQSGDGYTKWNQTSCILGHPAYAEPMMKAPSRIFGKPMAITEWQYCMPNRFRAESGPVMGAYSAFQDWDATYRFAWSHNSKNIISQQPMGARSWFDIASDPLNQISDKINVLMFRRRDVSVAKERHCYAVTREDVIRSGMGDMWKAGLFPNQFTALGYRHAIGSQVVDEKHPMKRKVTKVYSADRKNPFSKPELKGNVWAPSAAIPAITWSKDDVESDTKELSWSRAGRFTVATPRTEAIVAYPNGEKDGGFVAGGLSIKPVEKYQVVSASSLDGEPLRTSKKILLFHLTNMYNTDFTFDQPNWNCVNKWGVLPYLIQTGKAEVTFKSDVAGLELVALRYDGTPIRREKCDYANGAYTFTLAIEPTTEAVANYALVTAGSIEIDTNPPPPLPGGAAAVEEKIDVDPMTEYGKFEGLKDAFGGEVAAALNSRGTMIKTVCGIPGVFAIGAKGENDVLVVVANERAEAVEVDITLGAGWRLGTMRRLGENEENAIPPEKALEIASGVTFITIVKADAAE